MRRAFVALAFLAIGASAAAGAAVGCRDGEVWRAAAADDHVCVTPDTHRRTLAENAEAASHVRPRSTEMCLAGFVWRQAYPGDHVCVSPASRDQAAADNEAERTPVVLEPQRTSVVCALLDPAALAQRLGFGPGGIVRPAGDTECSLRFAGEANGEITIGYERDADAFVAARDFQRLHLRARKSIAGLGELASYDMRNSVDAWAHHLAALREDVSIELIYEGDPVPSGPEELRNALTELGVRLLAIVPSPPPCALRGVNDRCPIPVDLRERRGSHATLSGEIGKVRTWIYSVSGDTGDTIAIDFTGPEPMAGEMRCTGVSPRVWDHHGEVRLPAAGRCLVSIGAKPGSSGDGAFSVTLSRN
jgi:hypothetical protein